jgi:hypothetical protein
MRSKWFKGDAGFVLKDAEPVPLKLEYTNKEEADAARVQIAKGENVQKVASQSLLFTISKTMSQAYMHGHENGETEILSK